MFRLQVQRLAYSPSRSTSIHTSLGRRGFTIAATQRLRLENVLLPSLPGEVRKFWFQHLESDRNLILPTLADNMIWFMRNSDYDQKCVSQFGEAITAIEEANPSPERILDLVKPSSALDWLGLIILLDQLPRNCYRDGESAIIFKLFDPLALSIAVRAITAGFPSDPIIRYRLSYRMWFFLPLMHSEDMGVQDLCKDKYVEMMDDIKSVLDGATPGSLTGEEVACSRILASNRTATEELCALQMKSQREHYDIIARFGRYPHRNKVLGRLSTPEEERFLKDENSLS